MPRANSEEPRFESAELIQSPAQFVFNNVCPCVEILLPHIEILKRQMGELQRRVNEVAEINARPSTRSRMLRSSANGASSSVAEHRVHYEPQAETSSYDGLEISQIDDVFDQSVSRPNFATNLMMMMYNQHELLGRNCRGVKGKLALSPRRLQRIRHIVFQKNPLQGFETEKVAWCNCRKIMDSSLRRLNRHSQ